MPVAAATHRTLEELDAGLAHVREAPSDDGELRLIVRRPREGEREVLDEGVLDLESGLVGDDWGPRGDRRSVDRSASLLEQLTIMNSRVLEGIAGRLNLSTAVGAFVVGVALSGEIVSHARGLLLPLRNLFAAVFFVFFGLQVDTRLIPDVAAVAVSIAAVSVVAKVATGWIAAGRAGIGTPGRVRAGAALVAHGEFSIVIAELGIGREGDLGALAATYVVILTVVGAVLYQFSDVLTSASLNRQSRVP